MLRPLTMLQDDKKLELNNSGHVVLAKMINVNKITLREEFVNLFPIIPLNLQKIVERMQADGYDNSQPLQLWKTNGKLILIDGHHRREAAIKLNIYEVPCYIHEFQTVDEALEYAISLQTERRNLSDAELYKAIEVLDTIKPRGRGGDGKGKSAKVTAEILGTSISRIEKARAVNAHASDELKAKILDNKITHNAAYEIIRKQKQEEKTVKNKAKKKLDPFSCMNNQFLLLLETVKKYLDENNIAELRDFIENKLGGANEEKLS